MALPLRCVPRRPLLPAAAASACSSARVLFGAVAVPPGAVQRRNLSIEALDETKGERERILILGSGWAGFGLARALDTRRYQPVIITPRTYYVFTPLLASTAVGTLEFRTALESSRSLPGVDVVRGWADALDLRTNTLSIEGALSPPSGSRGDVPMAPDPSGRHKFNLSYDKLVVAVGAYSQTFNTPGVREHAFFLKDVGDARRIRRRIIDRFEAASLPTVTDQRKRELLHFAIVGGGPTGVEFAAELCDLVTEDIPRLYPGLNSYVRITVYDVAPNILSMFDEGLQNYAKKVFSRHGIQVKTSHHVLEVREDAVVTKQEGVVKVGAVVWSTGLAPNPFVDEALSREFLLDAPSRWTEPASAHSGPLQRTWRFCKNPRTGRLLVDEHLRALVAEAGGRDGTEGEGGRIPLGNVFAMGDCATPLSEDLPATAQVANQQAVYLAATLNKAARSHKPAPPLSPHAPAFSGPPGLVTQPTPATGLPPPFFPASKRGTVDVSTQKQFKFRSLGIMAYVGGWNAITQMGDDKAATKVVKSGNGNGNGKRKEVKGRMAWVLWRGAYLSKSVSWRNRLLIPVYWFINWVLGRDVNRF